MSTSNQPNRSRRHFFRKALERAVHPLADYLEERLQQPITRTCIRPPGAVAEPAFLETCYRCGACVNVCPARAIQPLAEEAQELAGTPVIDPDIAACTVCDRLKCTRTCPSGVLQPVTDPHAIRMGTACVYRPLCLRTRGDACTVCLDVCPRGVEALTCFTADPPEVLEAGCIGCGLCQQHCPTSPKAVAVIPR